MAAMMLMTINFNNCFIIINIIAEMAATSDFFTQYFKGCTLFNTAWSFLHGFHFLKLTIN